MVSYLFDDLFIFIGEMKLMEQRYGIVSQNITTDVAASACGLHPPPKTLTMENLVNKANMKNGGLNHEIVDQHK